MKKEVPVQDEKQDDRPLAGGILASPDKRRRVLDGKRFVFTSAQNNTYVHEEFLSSLLTFCEHNDARLIISPFTYNKNGFQNGTKNDDSLWYDPRIEEYFVNESCEVAPDLIFCGELDILPTAVNPLSGFENYTQMASGIVPHTKVRMDSLPRLLGTGPRFMYTTGTITLRNYIQRKAGQKAEFHHVFGALYVEIDDDGTWFARQLIASEDGVFYDLDTRYSPLGFSRGHRPEAIVWGDIHLEKLDDVVASASWFGSNSMLNVLQPKHQFIHDLIDFEARNHHNIKDPIHLAKMLWRATDSVEQSIHDCAGFLRAIDREGTKTVVVESNHDQAFERWLTTADIRTDPKNAIIFHEANARIYKAILDGDNEFKVFKWAIQRSDPSIDAMFVAEDESYSIDGIEYGMHGHRGPNGSRGTPRSFRSVGRKVITAHSHSAAIIDGVYVAGVSGKMQMGYNKGPSSWSHSHVITYPNGKRAIITLKHGKWRA